MIGKGFYERKGKNKQNMDGLAANGIDLGKMEEMRVMVRGDCSELSEWQQAFTAIYPNFPKEANYGTSCQHAVGALEKAPIPNWTKKKKIMELMAAGTFTDTLITEEVLHVAASFMNDALEEFEKMHEAEAVKKTVAKAEEGRGGGSTHSSDPRRTRSSPQDSSMLSTRTP